jgi:hypothetical protein
MHAAKLLFTGGREPWTADDGKICNSSTAGATQLVVYANVVLLLVLPCLVVYQLEWSQKDKFVRHSKQRLLSWPWPDSLLTVVFVLYIAVVAPWYACFYLINKLSLTCKGGRLVAADV